MGYIGQKISDVAVTVGQGVIDATHIQDASITTADLGNDAVTPNKIDDDATGFQMGTLGLGTGVSGSEKLTVGGAASFSGDITGTLATAAQTNITSVGTLTGLTVSGTVRIPHDTVDALRIGASDDLELWHNGTHSAVTNANTGKLYLWNYANGDTVIGSNDVESAVFTGANTTLRGTLNVAGASTFTGNAEFNGQVLISGTSDSPLAVRNTSGGEMFLKFLNTNGTINGAIVSNSNSNTMAFRAGGNTFLSIDSSSNSTFTGHMTIDGATHPILKLVGDPSGESTHIQLHRSNGQGFTIYDNSAALVFRADLSGSNPQILQLKSDKSATFLGNQLLNPSWSTTNIAFGSATSGFSAYNTGARIEVPLHATNGQAHGSFKFYTNSGDSANYSLLLAESGDISAQKRFYVLGNHSGNFGTELYNASSTGHGTKIRGGSTSSQYSLFVSNHDQTKVNFQVLGDGKCQTGSELTVGMNSTGFSAVKGSASVQLVNGGSIDVATGDNHFIMLSENTLGRGALFHCTYPQATPNRISDPNSIYSASDTANHVCVFSSANSSTTTIKNNMGSTLNFRIIVFGV